MSCQSRRSRSPASRRWWSLIVAILSAYHLATLARLSLEETRCAARCCAQRDLPARARGRRPRRRRSGDGAARGRRRPLHPRIRASATRRTSPTPRSSIATAWRSRTASRRRKGSRCPTRRSSAPLIGAAPIAQLKRGLFGQAPSRSASRCWPATSEFGSIRIGISTILVKDEFRTALNDRARQRRRGAADRVARRVMLWRSGCCGRST